MSGKEIHEFERCAECNTRPAFKRLEVDYDTGETYIEYAVGCNCPERYLYFTHPDVETFLPASWE